MISAGIDCGAKTTKTVILEGDLVIGRAIVPTGFDQTTAVNECLSRALRNASISRSDILRIGSTGSGAKTLPNIDIGVTDIKAIVAAGGFFFPNSRISIDVGAEEARAVKSDQQGRIVDFAINEKCAAGTGAFIEAMARALEVSIESMGELAIASDTTIALNAQCTIFAESEVIGLIHRKTDKKDICKAVHDALAGRIASMVRRVGVAPGIVMLGGVAHNPGIIKALQRELAHELLIPEHPEFGAAVGAALVASRT
jgi:benzoyl-CoA reductase subunit D